MRDAIESKKNYCEWIYSCFDGDPLPTIKNSIKNRHYHKGFMAEYKLAYALVRRAIETGDEPDFASWF